MAGNRQAEPANRGEASPAGGAFTSSGATGIIVSRMINDSPANTVWQRRSIGDRIFPPRRNDY